MKMTKYASVFFVYLTASTVSVVNADFLVIPKAMPEPAKAITYDAPSRGLVLDSRNVDSFVGQAPTINEHGSRTIFANAISPELSAFDVSVSSVITDLVPRGMKLELVRSEAMNQKISFQSKVDERWLNSLEQLLKQSDLNALINWNTSTISIRPNEVRTIATDSTREVVDDAGTEYVIRKKRDDISTINNNGYLIKDGQAFRLNVKE